MILLYAFLFCGSICLISQIILDNTNLTPGHVTSLLVFIGCFLDLFGIYDKIVLYCGGGAIIPITSFGHLLMHGAMEGYNDGGIMGFFSGIMLNTGTGICIAIVCGFIGFILFKPRN